MGFYEPAHRTGRWPFIYWDIRSYVNHPIDKEKRIYVKGFYAHSELRVMIQRMEQRFGTKNIVNKYINDNLFRVQTGVNQGKTPAKVEKEWSKGMMESLGYIYIEAIDTGPNKGVWKGVTVHWHKLENDKLL